jgi:hypothetical protein
MVLSKPQVWPSLHWEKITQDVAVVWIQNVHQGSCTIGRQWTCWRWGQVGSFRSLCPWRRLCNSGLYLLLFSGQDMNGFASPCTPCHDVLLCFTTGPKAVGPTGHGQKPPKLRWNEPFHFIKLIYSVICYNNRKLSNTDVNISRKDHQGPYWRLATRERKLTAHKLMLPWS